MRAAIRLLAVVMAALVATLAPQPASAAQKRVLMVTEARGYVHESIATTAALIRRLGGRSREYDVVPLRGAAALTRKRLRHADAVVFAHTTGELLLPDRDALLRFVRR